MNKTKLLLVAALSSLAIAGVTVTGASAHPGPRHVHGPAEAHAEPGALCARAEQAEVCGLQNQEQGLLQLPVNTCSAQHPKFRYRPGRNSTRAFSHAVLATRRDFGDAEADAEGCNVSSPSG